MRGYILAGLAAAFTAAPALAQSGGFCEGFRAGWAAAFQNRGMIVAVTPVCPVPPVGGNSFQVGYERGLTAALGYLAQQR